MLWYSAVLWYDTPPLFYKTRHGRSNTAGDNPEPSANTEPEVR